MPTDARKEERSDPAWQLYQASGRDEAARGRRLAITTASTRVEEPAFEERPGGTSPVRPQVLVLGNRVIVSEGFLRAPDADARIRHARVVAAATALEGG